MTVNKPKLWHLLPSIILLGVWIKHIFYIEIEKIMTYIEFGEQYDAPDYTIELFNEFGIAMYLASYLLIFVFLLDKNRTIKQRMERLFWFFVWNGAASFYILFVVFIVETLKN